MQQVGISGSKLFFVDADNPTAYFEVDYGERLLRATRVGSDVVIVAKEGEECYMHRRALDASTKWILTHPCTDKVLVADDDRSLSVNGTAFHLPNTLRSAHVKPDAVVAVVYTNGEIQGRNVYRYNRDGTLKWQIGERKFDHGIPFNSVSFNDDGTLKAEGFVGSRGTGAIVDYDTGEILAREDPR